MKAILATWVLTPVRMMFLALLVCSSAGAAQAAPPDWYVGLGAGVSRLTPDTNRSDLTLDSKSSSAIGVVAGWGLSERIALEAALTHLGNAELSGDATIDYSVLSGGAIGYWYGDATRVRQGSAPAAFARLGLSFVKNSSDVELEKEDNTAIWAALGIDVPLRGRWGMRAEIGSFDGDAQAALVSLIWRPNGTGASGPEAGMVSDDTIAPAIESNDAATTSADVDQPDGTVVESIAAEPEPAEPVSSAASDVEAAPIPDDEPIAPDSSFAVEIATDSTECITPKIGEPIDARRCAVFAGVLEDVTFQRETDQLTSRAKSQLDQLVESLDTYPRAGIELRAHVARQAAGAEADAALARSRAIAVARYLVTKGIDVARLRARSFGSTQPRLPGTSAAATAANERIEIVYFTP